MFYSGNQLVNTFSSIKVEKSKRNIYVYAFVWACLCACVCVCILVFMLQLLHITQMHFDKDMRREIKQHLEEHCEHNSISFLRLLNILLVGFHYELYSIGIIIWMRQTFTPAYLQFSHPSPATNVFHSNGKILPQVMALQMHCNRFLFSY